MHARVSTTPAPAGSPAVVLVHGLVVSSRYMIPTAEKLASYHEVYVPDLPGFGRSEKPPSVLDVAGLSDSLAAWMETAGLTSAVLVGNSVGCQVVAELALRHPGAVERAVLQGPTMDPEARTALRQAARLALDGTREPPSLLPIMLLDYVSAGLHRSFSTFRYALGDPIEEKLPRVRVPTLVVRGDRDPIVPKRWAERVARLLPKGRLVVAGRSPHHELRRALGARARGPGVRAGGRETVKTPSYVANFDSATAMLRACAAYLRGEDFPALGALPKGIVPIMRPVTAAVNALPRRLREEVYARASSNEAIRPEELRLVSAERVSRWMVGEYPRRRYPAAAVGSSGGALVHLYAALGIPWLPQTFLVPVKNQGIPVDEPRASMEWGERHAPALLKANPELVLHHMHETRTRTASRSPAWPTSASRGRASGRRTSGSWRRRWSRAARSFWSSAGVPGRRPASASATSSSTGL